MRHLLDNSLWLLVPGPGKEERSTGSAVGSLLLAVFFALNAIFFDFYGFVPDFMEPSFGAHRPPGGPVLRGHPSPVLGLPRPAAASERCEVGRPGSPHARRSGVSRVVSDREDGRVRHSGRGAARANASVRQPFFQPSQGFALVRFSDGLRCADLRGNVGCLV